MEGFKKLPKGVSCYREGGSVYKSRHSEKSEMSEDIAQDKKIVKKAFAMHDKQEHPGEKTNLSKLKKGGRTKKAVGTVKKFACGGGVYGAKKTEKDLKSIQEAKDCKPKKLADGGLLQESGKPAHTVKVCMGGKIKKADGGIVDTVKSAGKKLYENVMGTPEQNRIAQEQMDKQAREGSKLAKFLGGKADAQSAPVSKKSGGKVCYSEGGSLKETDAEKNPGLAKLPTNVRNKMGYMRHGGKAKKMNTGGTCS